MELPPEWSALNPIRQADTETLRGLNAHAVEHRRFGVTQEGVDALDPDAIHVGIPFYVFDLADADDSGGRPVRKDQWLGVAWATYLSDGSGVGMFLGCRASAYYDLAEGEMSAEHRADLQKGARAFMSRASQAGRFLVEDEDGQVIYDPEEDSDS